jgi:hypothetical protein
LTLLLEIADNHAAGTFRQLAIVTARLYLLAASGLMTTPLRLLSLFTAVLATSSLGAAELFVNGNFENGNTGFTTEYLNSLDGFADAGEYTVTGSPINAHPSWSNFANHTLGGQLLMAANASLAGTTVWRETVDVVPGQNYAFSAWAATNYPVSPASLNFRTTAAGEFGVLNLTTTAGLWANFNAIVNSGANSSLTFEIIDLNHESFGNDFSLDDLSLTGLAVPEPTCLRLLGLAGLLCSRLRLRSQRYPVSFESA